jgi:DNA invertase Pin-like site-specific DNA recombinase
MNDRNDPFNFQRFVDAQNLLTEAQVALAAALEEARNSGASHYVSMRVSKADGSQVLDLQRDALIADGVKPSHLYQDQASGKKDDRPGLEACLKSLREGDTLVVWKLDRLGRDLRHLVNTIHDLMERKIGFRVLTGQGANIDTTTASGRLVFGIFAALAEFERELIRERTIAGLLSARARGRNGGRPYTMTPAKLRLAQAAMSKRDTKVGELCKELGVTQAGRVIGRSLFVRVSVF